MKRRDLLAAAAVATLPAAALAQAAPPAAAPKGVVDELKALLETQAKQWSAGDLDGFCSHYAEDCLFLSPGGLTKGRKEVLATYKKKYPDRSMMGKLMLEVLSARHDDTLATLALGYTLAVPGMQKDAGYSLIGVEKVAGRWQIVHDASM